MPVWEVSEPQINLWLYDEPLGYQPGLGEKISFKLSYKQRETRFLYDGVSGNYTGVGPGWNCSWVSYLHRDIGDTGEDDENGDPIIGYLGTATMVMGDGGQRTLKADGTTPEYYRQGLLTPTANLDGSWSSAVIEYPDGSKEEFDTVTTTPLVVGATEILYRTAKFDRFGNATRFHYDASTSLLQKVVDADGRTNTLSYTGALITSVQDPFGRTATLQYYGSGWLSNITDVVGLSSSFQYDTNGWVTKLTTPYGDTHFEFLGNGFSDLNEVVRAIRVVDAVGGTNLYMFRQWLDYPAMIHYPDYRLFPINHAQLEYSMGFRNSFHWGPRQAASLPTDLVFQADDYRKARIRHWLHNDQTYEAGTFDYMDYTLGLSQTLSFEVEPGVDNTTYRQATFYDYGGKTPGDFNFKGTQAVPSLITRVIPDGTLWYKWMLRDELGRATNVVESYSTAYGETPQARTNRYIYDGADLVVHFGPNGNVENGYAYNANHQVTFHTNAVGEVTEYTYDTPGRLIRTKTPAGLTTTNIFLPSGDYPNFVAQVIDLEINRTNSYTYLNNLVATHTDERSLTTTNFWDALQRLRRVSYPDGTYITNSYGRLDLTQRVDRLGFVNSYTYDAVRRKTSQTDALGRTTIFDFCTCGAMTYMQDAAGNFTYYYYDDVGNLTNTVYADGYSVTNTYDYLNRIISVTDSAGISTTNWHNNQGLVYLTQNAAGTTAARYYDIEDHPIYVTDANGVIVTNVYDELHRLHTRTYPDGGVERFGYSARGLVAYTNQLDFVTFYGYDAAHRKLCETNANTEVIWYTNNAAGDLLSLTDGKNQITRWKYDEYGRVTNKLDQAGAEIFRYKYDPNSRLTNRWTAAKGDTKYKYDPVGNLTNVDYAVSTDVRFRYDAMNRMTNMVDAMGTTKFTHSAAGQLLTEDGPWSNDTITNTYYHRLRVKLDLQQPTGLWTNAFTYDYAKRLYSVKSPAGYFEYQYRDGLPGTLVQKLLLGNSSYITNAYDENARLLNTYLRTSANVMTNRHEYLYNVGNQRRQQAFRDGSIVAYANDPIGQLTVANSSINSEDRGYKYDAAWNLNYRTNNGTLYTFTVDGLNQLTFVPGGNCAYDANGNLTTNAASAVTSYEYDDENRLTAVTSLYYPDGGGLESWRVAFGYDGLGRLRKRTELSPAGGGEWEVLTVGGVYIYDGMRVVQERILDGGVVSDPEVSYTWGSDLSGSMEGAGGIGGLLGRSHGYSSGNWSTHSYYHADGNGNVTYMLNSSQSVVASYKYDPYGNTLSSSGSLADENVYRFSSKASMNSLAGVYGPQLYYYGYRWYAPSLQRWMNRDPIGENGGINLYGFVDNNPIDSVDFLGLSSQALNDGPLPEELQNLPSLSEAAAKGCDNCEKAGGEMKKNYELVGTASIRGCARAMVDDAWSPVPQEVIVGLAPLGFYPPVSWGLAIGMPLQYTMALNWCSGSTCVINGIWQ